MKHDKSGKTAFTSRLKGYLLAHPVLAVAIVAGFATAAVSISYTNPSTVATGVTPAPIQFAAGDDSAASDYVSAFSVSTNKTYITTTVKGVPEATLTVGSLFKLENVDDASHEVTVSTAQVSNGYVSAYTIRLYDSADDSLQGTLTLTDASPSATMTMAAGKSFYATLTLTLASGAGTHNVALSNSLSLSVA